MELRKISVFVDDVLSEGGRKLLSPTRRVAACGVIRNPFAGKPPSGRQEFAAAFAKNIINEIRNFTQFHNWYLLCSV